MLAVEGTDNQDLNLRGSSRKCLSQRKGFNIYQPKGYLVRHLATAMISRHAQQTTQ